MKAGKYKKKAENMRQILYFWTYSKQRNSNFPQKVWCFVSIFTKNGQH